MKKTILATLLGATLLGGTAYATVQQAPGRGDPMMKADTNSDGILTRQEVLAAADARFAKMDADKNGQISREEQRAGKPHRVGMHKPRVADDAKRTAFRQKMLERFDTDKDGKLSDTERQAARQQRQAKHPEGRGSGTRAMARHFDANGDGLVSLAEMRTTVTAHFDRVDANHNGSIDKAEREAAHAKMKAMRGHSRHHGGTAPTGR
jgi:Ca2+-binding EF-hand superfamily protein